MQDAAAKQNGDKVMIVRLQPDVVDYLLSAHLDSKEVLLPWTIPPCELNIVTTGDGSNEVTARCQLVRVDTLNSLFELRKEARFAAAPRSVKASFRELLSKKRPIYKWLVEGVTAPIEKMLAPPFHGTWTFAAVTEARPETTATLPDMSLKSTAKFFIGRLDKEDYHLLCATARFLDGKTIRIGTTCSGTDGCLNVVRATLDVLNEEFKASLACYSRMLHFTLYKQFECLHLIYIYIVFWVYTYEDYVNLLSVCIYI